MRRRHYRYSRIIVLILILTFGIVVMRIFGQFFLRAATPIILHKAPQLHQTNGRLNILLLGIGGGVHDGPNLTDTIIFASIALKKKEVTLISLPRDFWVPEIKGKINTAYAIGQQAKKGGGLILTKSTISHILNQPIHYSLRIDFDGFTKIVDALGGLDVHIDRTFDDYTYPDESHSEDLCGHSLEEATTLIATGEPEVVFPCRYMHVHFDKGVMHMSGSQALIFVRSRHAQGPEGSDFARSKRQEKVIQAIKDKVFSVQTFFNFQRIMNIYKIVQSSIDTDIVQDDFGSFLALVQQMKKATIHTYVLDTGDSDTKREGLLINPPITSEYNNEWVLSPRTGNGNYTEIQEYVKCLLSKKIACVVKPLQ